MWKLNHTHLTNESKKKSQGKLENILKWMVKKAQYENLKILGTQQKTMLRRKLYL